MKRITFLTKITALMAVVALAGTAIAQPSAPSLVTQQLRLSTGSGNYINIRAGANSTAGDANPYFLDNAPQPPVATESYALWLDGTNHIRQSIKFQPVAGAPGSGIGGPGYLYRVNAAGTGTEWVLPSDITDANNGLVADKTTVAGTTIVQLGGATSVAGAAVPFTSDRFVNLATHALNFEGGGAFNVGLTGAVTNMTFDQGLTGTITMPNVPAVAAPLATDRLMILDLANQVHTRLISSLVDANNGLVLDVSGATPTVQLGGATSVAGLAVAFSASRFVNLGGNDMNWEGAGNFNIGSGTAVQNIKLDPGATGFVRMNNIPASVTPLATDRFTFLDATNNVNTRLLSSLVDGNNGIEIDLTSTPGTAIVQLGAAASADVSSALAVDRFINMNSHAISFEQNGTVNLGTATSNMAVNVNTGTSNMTITGANLASPVAATPAASDFHNIAYVESATNVVHTITAANMARNDAPTDYVAIDPASGNFVKAISPTAAIARGQEPWTGWQQTITLSGTQVIAAGAAITVSLQNPNTGGTVAIQVTSVTPGTGAAANFHIETSDVPPSGAGEFINWVVINP
jgi:hypothetical protein